MRHPLVILLTSSALIVLLLPSMACTHSTRSDANPLPSELADAASPTEGKTEQVNGSSDEGAILSEMAPEIEPAQPSATLDSSSGEDPIDPNQYGLTSGLPEPELEQNRPSLAPDLRGPTPKAKKKAKKTKVASKKVKSNSALTMAHDGDDSAPLQSESVGSDPTSRVAEVSVSFRSGSSNLSKRQVLRLKELASQLKNERQLKVSLSVKSDSKGNAKRNKALAAKRAQAVKSVLLKNGAKASQIRIEPIDMLAARGQDASQGRIVEVFLQN